MLMGFGLRTGPPGIGVHRLVALLGSFGIEPQFAMWKRAARAFAATWFPVLFVGSQTSWFICPEP
jgi:hypothetical protein